MHLFFISFETEYQGYILSIFDNYESCKAYFDKCEHLLSIPKFKLMNFLKNKRSYKLNNDEFAPKVTNCMSTGIRSVNLLETGKYWRSIEHYIADREYIPTFIDGADLNN
jgi:hypothetical protein